MSSTSANSTRNQKRIDRLFLRFSAMYGHVWRSIYKTDDFLKYSKEAWLKGLSGFEDKNFEHALRVCLKTYPLPPTLPQFIECCKSYHAASDFVQAAKVDQKRDLNVAYAHLQQIKTMLNI